MDPFINIQKLINKTLQVHFWSAAICTDCLLLWMQGSPNNTMKYKKLYLLQRSDWNIFSWTLMARMAFSGCPGHKRPALDGYLCVPWSVEARTVFSGQLDIRSNHSKPAYHAGQLTLSSDHYISARCNSEQRRAEIAKVISRDYHNLTQWCRNQSLSGKKPII